MQSKQKNITKYSVLAKRSVAWSAIIVSCISISFAFGETANAGLISLMSSFLSGEKVSAKESRITHYVNSQNMQLLAAATNRDPNPDKVADTVPVEDGETLVADMVASNIGVSDPGNAQISTYVVREGDTVSGVAKMFDVSINTVLWANDITSKSILRAGQTLVILPISGLNYTVKKGDTLQGIAKSFNADTEEILAYNDLKLSSSLSIGQTIIIPNAELSVSASQSSSQRAISRATGGPLLAGYFMRPVAGGTKTQGLHGHNGVDIAAPLGTPLLASAAGTVIINRVNGAWNGGYGNYVVISHPNGTQTLYAHMLKSVVSAGERVAKGQKIGSMGSTGLSTGSHVHFEIRGAKNPF